VTERVNLNFNRKSNTCTHAQRLSQEIDHGFESKSTFHLNRKASFCTHDESEYRAPVFFTSTPNQTFTGKMTEPKNRSHRFKSNSNFIFNRKLNTCTHAQRLSQEIDHRFESNSTFHRNRKANFCTHDDCNTASRSTTASKRGFNYTSDLRLVKKFKCRSLHKIMVPEKCRQRHLLVWHELEM
jgi:hypothetical protein